MNEWYKNPIIDEGLILSSRIRLARNVKKYYFNKKLSNEMATELVKEGLSSVMGSSLGTQNYFLETDMASLDNFSQRMLIEKHIISPFFYENEDPRGLLISKDNNVSIMINEEDHIRIQSIKPGDDLNNAFDMANQLDDLMEERMEFAFHHNYGYITSCPTNFGTGLRASYMIHLPCLEKTNLFKTLIPTIANYGVTIRGMYGEGTAPMGSVYQISNQTTLGKSEHEMIELLKSVTKRVMTHEADLRKKIAEGGKQHSDMLDLVHRAYGILSYTRRISAAEAMGFLSQVKIGYMMGILEKPRLQKRIYEIMMEIQPGHLQKTAGVEMTEQERDHARASYLREIFI